MFVDTSALAKLYHWEVGTDVMEMQSVFAGKVRTGQLAQSAADLLRLRFRGDLDGRRFKTVAIQSRHYHTADFLIVRHGAYWSTNTRFTTAVRCLGLGGERLGPPLCDCGSEPVKGRGLGGLNCHQSRNLCLTSRGLV